jgi:hypothetical protein
MHPIDLLPKVYAVCVIIIIDALAIIAIHNGVPEWLVIAIMLAIGAYLHFRNKAQAEKEKNKAPK